MTLDKPAAEAALERSFAPLGLDPRAAAQGIYEVVNQTMLAASKVHIAERGEDARNFHLFAFGGAGPAHAYEIARALDMKGVVVPPAAGAASAMGLVVSPVAFDLSHSVPGTLEKLDWAEIAAAFDGMLAEGRAVLADAGVGTEAQSIYQMDLRHEGQGREITVDIPGEVIEAGDVAAICRLFYDAHRQRFGHVHLHLPVELITCRLSISGEAIVLPDSLRSPAAETAGDPLKGSREVYFPELNAFVEVPVFDRMRLPAGFACPGPAIIEERECTTVAGPSATVSVGSDGTLFLDLPGGGTALREASGARTEAPATVT